MAKTAHPDAGADKPEYVIQLESAYGAPSQAAFGSAVFFEHLRADDDLAVAALAVYRHFTGDLWEWYGEQSWMGPWREVYARKVGAKPDIAAELSALADTDVRISVPMILEVVQSADQARASLAAAYDDPAVTDLRIFNLGDGEAMSGILVAGRRSATGGATFLVFLMD